MVLLESYVKSKLSIFFLKSGLIFSKRSTIELNCSSIYLFKLFACSVVGLFFIPSSISVIFLFSKSFNISSKVLLLSNKLFISLFKSSNAFDALL